MAVDREFLQDLIRRALTEWAGPPAVAEAEGGRAVLHPVWLSVSQIHERIKSHATQLPGVGKDQVNRITRVQLQDELRAMKDIRRRDLNTPTEAYALGT
ncbi:MAG: hypothetical protein M9894_12855 [Planctomycetes bacterium]|nr:hypothetical protein [Planctomycetota bacterium]